MLLDVKRVSDFDLARVEKSMWVFKAGFADLDFCPNNIAISQFNLFEFNFGL